MNCDMGVCYGLCPVKFFISSSIVICVYTYSHYRISRLNAEHIFLVLTSPSLNLTISKFGFLFAVDNL